MSASLRDLRPIQLFIAGAPKSGTTSLKEYLGEHPQVCTHPQREFIYFTSDRAFASGYARAVDLYFGGCRAEDAVLVAKSVALMYSPTGLRRLQEHNPGVHLTLVLRNPIDRAYSEFWYARRRGWDDTERFEDAVVPTETCLDDRFGPTAYLARGHYAQLLETMLDLFTSDHVHIFTLRELHTNPAGVCRSLYAVLPTIEAGFATAASGSANQAAQARSDWLARHMSHPGSFSRFKRAARLLLPERTRQRVKNSLRSWNETAFSPPPMSPDTRRHLVEYYRPWNERLEELFDRSFAGWNE